ADASSKLTGLERGADAYLSKPFSERELLTRLRKLTELRAKLKEHYQDLATVFDRKKVPPPILSREHQFVEDLQKHIEARLDDPDLGVDELSRSMHMSRAQLYRKWSALTGKPLGEFIRVARLHKARHLLMHSGLNVTEVASEVGYRNLSTFSRSFRAEFGVKPSALIKGRSDTKAPHDHI
ncbi:MAG: helix-turn-helix domain-containing protein, partial [Saprospiraceae bacterium]|nr:helix-turn-helix domain-containing protein [Saprospiraceae bacterium]